MTAVPVVKLDIYDPIERACQRVCASSARSLRQRCKVARSVTGKPWADVTLDDLVRLRAWLIEHRAPATGRVVLSAVQQVLDQLVRDGVLDRDRRELLRDVPPIKGNSPRVGRRLKGSEIRKLFESCDESARGRCDAVVLALLIGCGLRVSEVASRRVEHVREGALDVVRSKGGKSRAVPLPPDVRVVLDRWISHGGSFVVVPVDKAGAVDTSRGVSTRALQKRVAAVSRRAGVAPWTSHDGRRTTISDLLEDSVPLHVVQSIVGHADPRTTARYARGEEQAAHKAMARRRLPGAQR